MALVFPNFKSGYDKGISILNWPVGILCFIGVLLMGKDTKPILSKMKKCDRIHFAYPVVATLVLFIIGICLIIFNPSNRTLWLAMILAPFGGLSRHFLGMYLNGWKRYPLGTFLANLFGSLILTVLTVSRISISSSNETGDKEWNPILEITSIQGMRLYFKNQLLTGPKKPTITNKSHVKMITFPILLFYRLDLDFVRRCQQFLVSSTTL